MSEFFGGMLACAGVLGGLCAFIYWVFNLMEKRLEVKFDTMSTEIHKIAEEMKEERRSKDYLYKFVMDHCKEKS